MRMQGECLLSTHNDRDCLSPFDMTSNFLMRQPRLQIGIESVLITMTSVTSVRLDTIHAFSCNNNSSYSFHSRDKLP